MWQLSHDDVESIAIGSGILGTGGGGNPYLGKIHMQSLLAAGYAPVIISLDELADDALVAEIGTMGAPTVGVEKLPHGDEPQVGHRSAGRLSRPYVWTRSFAPRSAAPIPSSRWWPAR